MAVVSSQCGMNPADRVEVGRLESKRSRLLCRGAEARERLEEIERVWRWRDEQGWKEGTEGDAHQEIGLDWEYRVLQSSRRRSDCTL